MAVATAAALIGTGISAFQTIKGASDKKAAQSAMDNYRRVELDNPYKNIQLSTYGTDIMRQDAALNLATLSDDARSAGVRGVMGAIPKLQAGYNKVSQQIGIDLEKQDLDRQYAVAQGDERILRMKEQRDNQNINAISSQYNAANEDFNRGLWGVASGLTSWANQADFGGFTPQVSSVNAGIQPVGVQPIGLSGGGLPTG